MVNPIDYSGGNGFLQGLQTAGAYQQIQQQKAMAEQAKRQQQLAQQFQADWQAAYGDPAKMEALAAKYPGQMDTIKGAIGFKDDIHRQSLGSAARDLRVALASGNPQAVQQAATQHASTLQSIGSSVEDVLQQMQSDPQGLAHTIDAVGMSALGAKDFYGVQNDRAQRQNDAAKLAETVRSNQAGEALQARGQDITVRGQNISASNSAADRDLRKLILEQQVITNQLNQSKTKTEIDGLRMKQQDNLQKQQDLQQQKQMSQGYAAEAAQIARSLASDPNLSQVTGSVASRLPVVRDSSQDILNQATRLQSLLTQDNLKLMSGVLTDRDIVFLGNISSGLNVTDSGIKGSESSIRKRLATIAEKLDSKLTAQGYTPPPAAAATTQSQSGFSSLWGE